MGVTCRDHVDGGVLCDGGDCDFATSSCSIDHEIGCVEVLLVTFGFRGQSPSATIIFSSFECETVVTL